MILRQVFHSVGRGAVAGLRTATLITSTWSEHTMGMLPRLMRCLQSDHRILVGGLLSYQSFMQVALWLAYIAADFVFGPLRLLFLL